MHGAPFPCPPAKASLLLVCAHAWEARPFLRQLDLKSIERGGLPFPTYQNASTFLLLTGTGRARACMAVAGFLSQELEGRAGAGLLAPPLVVANFGTAGANAGTWAIGQTLLVSRVRDGQGESLYPERLASWGEQEAECRTVASPQREPVSGSPLFDMEAFAVAEAAALFLSSAHMVVGKCVSDHLGEAFDVASLAARCQADYDRGALAFLEHALEHQQILQEDARRLKSLEVAGQVTSLLAEVTGVLPLSVTQQRELSQALRGRLAFCQDSSQVVAVTAGLREVLAEGATGKAHAKTRLAQLLRLLQASWAGEAK